MSVQGKTNASGRTQAVQKPRIVGILGLFKESYGWRGTVLGDAVSAVIVDLMT